VVKPYAPGTKMWLDGEKCGYREKAQEVSIQRYDQNDGTYLVDVGVHHRWVPASSLSPLPERKEEPTWKEGDLVCNIKGICQILSIGTDNVLVKHLNGETWTLHPMNLRPLLDSDWERTVKDRKVRAYKNENGANILMCKNIETLVVSSYSGFFVDAFIELAGIPVMPWSEGVVFKYPEGK